MQRGAQRQRYLSIFRFTFHCKTPENRKSKKILSSNLNYSPLINRIFRKKKKKTFWISIIVFPFSFRISCVCFLWCHLPTYFVALSFCLGDSGFMPLNNCVICNCLIGNNLNSIYLCRSLLHYAYESNILFYVHVITMQYTIFQNLIFSSVLLSGLFIYSFSCIYRLKHFPSPVSISFRFCDFYVNKPKQWQRFSFLFIFLIVLKLHHLLMCINELLSRIVRVVLRFVLKGMLMFFTSGHFKNKIF